MHTLSLFKASPEQISLTGDIQFLNNKLQIDFCIEAPNTLIDFNNQKTNTTSLTQRANELWKQTCFEAFWSPPAAKYYWEFNIAANGLWNIYYFNSYRNPTLPQESFDFELAQFNFSSTHISISLENKTDLSELEASLTAIVKTHSKQTLYFASQHSGNKPDFHIRESFQLKRSKSL